MSIQTPSSRAAFHVLLPLRSVALACLAAALLAGCASAPKPRRHGDSGDRIFRDGSSPQLLADAEDAAPQAGAKILAQARKMTVDKKLVLPGSCWDYINAVWDRAGFPDNKRQVTFRGSRSGPFAEPKDIKPGDWLYFVNHSYGDVDHSALFVAWANGGGDRQAYMLSYAGKKRAEPARYMLYDLSDVYRIIRAKD